MSQLSFGIPIKTKEEGEKINAEIMSAWDKIESQGKQ